MRKMVTTRSRAQEVQIGNNSLLAEIEALRRASSKADPVVVELKRRHPAISFRPQSSLDVWRKQLLAVLEPESRPTRISRPPAPTVPGVLLHRTDVSVDVLHIPGAASLMTSQDLLPDAQDSQVQNEGESHHRTIALLRASNRSLADGLLSARLRIRGLEVDIELLGEMLTEQAASQRASQRTTSQHALRNSPQDDATETTTPPPPPPPVTSSAIVTGLIVGSSHRPAFKEKFADFCRGALQMRSVPCFKVVKVFDTRTGGRRSAILRFDSAADLASVMNAKAEFLTANSPVSIEINRTRAARTTRAAQRTEQRGSGARLAWTRGPAVPRVHAGRTRSSGLNPHAAVFVPSAQRAVPNQE